MNGPLARKTHRGTFMGKHMNILTKKLTVIAAVLLASTHVNAASMSYFINQSNGPDDGTNVARVTIADSMAFAGDIEFTVEVLTDAFVPGPNFGMQSFYFNADDSLSIAAGNIVDIDPSWGVSTGVNAGGGFGKFDFGLNGDGSSRTELLSFRISGVTGDSISSYALLSGLNPGSTEYFAAQISDFQGSETGAKYAGSDVVPIPASVWLMGSALGLLGWMKRKQNLASAAV